MAENKEYIYIKGARANNLKGIDLKIPRGKLVVVSGLSGSGKSSLAFDTLFAEGGGLQRAFLLLQGSSWGGCRSLPLTRLRESPLP